MTAHCVPGAAGVPPVAWPTQGRRGSLVDAAAALVGLLAPAVFGGWIGDCDCDPKFTSSPYAPTRP